MTRTVTYKTTNQPIDYIDYTSAVTDSTRVLRVRPNRTSLQTNCPVEDKRHTVNINVKNSHRAMPVDINLTLADANQLADDIYTIVRQIRKDINQ